MTETLVLLMFGESLAAPEAYHRIKAHGYRSLVVCRRGTSLRKLGYADAEDRLVVTPPEVSFHSCCEELSASLATLPGRVAILALEDAALVATESLALDDATCHSGLDLVRFAMDKPAQYRIAAQSGFEVPYWCESGEGLGVWDGPDGAVIVKPALAGWVGGDRFQRGRVFYAASPKDGFLIAQEQDHACIVQSVVEGCGEGVFGLALNGECHRLSGHRRIRMMNPAGSGSSACRSIDPEPQILEAVERFIKASPVRGMFMVELLRTCDGTAYFMELNARAWGSLALAHHRGLDYAVWSAQCLIGEPLSPWGGPGPHRLCRHLGREVVHVLHLLRGNRNKASNWPSRRSILRMLWSGEPTCWYNKLPGRRCYQFIDAASVIHEQIRGKRS